jgi:hypothetical protein
VDLSQETLLAAADVLDAIERVSNGDAEGAERLIVQAMAVDDDRVIGLLLSFAANFAEHAAAALGCLPADLYAAQRQVWGRAALEGEVGQ